MIALAFSGGKDSMACLHLMRDELDCAIYVDTGVTYPETRQMVDYAASLIPMHIVKSDRHGQNAAHGIPSDIVPIDWTTLGQQMSTPKPVRIQSSLQCCWENLCAPLLAKAKALGVTELVFGQRDDEAHRSIARDGDLMDGIRRRHPIESWARHHVLEYLAAKMTVPEHYALQHSSLDCYDCTAYAKESEDRVAWTKARYPDFHEAYQVRRQAIYNALLEAV